MSAPNNAHPNGVLSIVVAGAILLGGSPLLIEHLRKWESSGKTVLTVYPDKLAGNLPTVCDGLTRHVTDTPIRVGDKWTLAQCEAETQRAVIKLQRDLAKCFKRAPNQTVFDMATSHGWNFGASATCGSLAMQAWNAGQWELGCRRLALSDAGRPVWSYVCEQKGGERVCHFVQGLANRRQDEFKQCVGSLS